MTAGHWLADFGYYGFVSFVVHRHASYVNPRQRQISILLGLFLTALGIYFLEQGLEKLLLWTVSQIPVVSFVCRNEGSRKKPRASSHETRINEHHQNPTTPRHLSSRSRSSAETSRQLESSHATEPDKEVQNLCWRGRPSFSGQPIPIMKIAGYF